MMLPAVKGPPEAGVYGLPKAIIRKAGSLLEPAFALWWRLQAFCLRLNRNVGFDCLLSYSS